MVRVTVAAQTAISYTNACSFAQAAAIARTSLATAENSLRLVTAQERAGSVGRFEVEQAATAVANARAAVAPLDAQRRVALFELAALIGETPAGVPEEALKCTHPPAPSAALPVGDGTRSEEHTSELQSLMRISYAVFCLKK